MESKSYVLDSSALFALIENEDGAERVESILSEEKAFLPCLALLEVHYITRQERGQGEADRRYALLRQLPCEILWQLDEPVLLTASRFQGGSSAVPGRRHDRSVRTAAECRSGAQGS